MAMDAEILLNAYKRENNPNRIERYRPWAWEAYAVGATREDIRRLKDEGYIIEYGQINKTVLFLLTDKGKKKGG